MEIIAHRGFWKETNEKNQKEAFERARNAMIGTETDFRDYMQKLVISHNVAGPTCMDADDFFALYKDQKFTLALGIRPDFCLEPPYTGPCKARIIRYFYNAKAGLCQAFVYGGCRAKRNNFKSAEDCMRTCGGA
ncbi:BPTI/Kunitz-type proteinase inhibitor domain-containing protein [Streptococcus equinus]|uniref:Trypsin inhibitor domain-containing protein n=1 Tax=Streptococcus equinus JB1 TaxID=1294274 RepID=A0A1I4I797_STREI|nr:BPTI/Kunitz-type proteinase inhibitor domain-containing protein [Streptococcus equinus]SFL49973.1 trypsin inhibitor domain-containing protein [Streptococcus equinus JB1]